MAEGKKYNKLLELLWQGTMAYMGLGGCDLESETEKEAVKAEKQPGFTYPVQQRMKKVC